MNLIHTVNVMNPTGDQSVDSSRIGEPFSEQFIKGQDAQQVDTGGTIFTINCGYDDPLGADNVMNPVGSQSEDGLRTGSQFFEPLIRGYCDEVKGVDDVGQESEIGFSSFDLNKEPGADEVSYGLFTRTRGFIKQLSDYLDFDLNAAGNKEESSAEDASPSRSMRLHLDLNECQKDVIRLFGTQYEVNDMDTGSRPNGHCGFAPDQCVYGIPIAATPPPGFCQQPQPFFLNMAGGPSVQLELGLNHGFVVNEGNNGGLWSSVNCRHQQPPTTLALFS